MPTSSSKKTVRPIPSKKPHRHRDGHGAHWHIMLWIALIAVVYSVSTISLAASAQGTTTGYQRNATGILQAISDIRRDVREISGRVQRIESSLPR